MRGQRSAAPPPARAILNAPSWRGAVARCRSRRLSQCPVIRTFGGNYYSGGRVPFRRLAIFALLATAACRPAGALSASEQRAIADSLRTLVANAYSFRASDPVAGLLALYPDSGRVVSAAAGRITTTREALRAELRYFWENIGQNMRNPRFTWTESYADVLSRDAAVLTGRYVIRHITPSGEPHEIGGAWTALFERRGGRWVITQEHLSDVPEAPGADSAAVAGGAAPGDSTRPPRPGAPR